MHTAVIPGFFLAACAALSAQDVQVEKYTLDNGMDVILHEDHSLPSVVVNIWYGVGSKDEQPHRSGFAHLFEHLMFMGTKRMPGSGFDDLMEAGGGHNNASTSNDRTNYYSLGPSNLLETLLWLDADRLEDFGKAMTQEKLDKQRDVVRNERRQNTEMRPYGKAEEALSSLLYPPAHPYFTSVIGSHTDLEAASLQDVKDFFATYYVPNNASLVVAGDFEPKTIKPLIAKWFGTLPRGKVVPRRAVPPVKLTETRKATFYDRVQFARLSLIWPSPAFFKPGDATMDLIAALLSGGKSSRLYKRLVYDDKLASSVAAYQYSRALAGEFRIQAIAAPGVDLERIRKAIDEELARLISEGPTADELERQKTKLEYQSVSSLESLRARADRLNLYNFHLGKPNGFAFDLERYRGQTIAQIQTYASQVLGTKHRLEVAVLPQPKTQVDPRDARPAIAKPHAFGIASPTTFRLSNGIEVRHWQRDDLPLVRASLLIRQGSMSEPPEKAGVTNLMAQMLTEGAGERDALQFASALDRLGATIGVAPGRLSTVVSVESLASKFPAALALCADAVRAPRLEAKEFARIKSLHLQSLRRNEDNPGQVSRLVGTLAFFGKGHPLGRPAAGTRETVDNLTSDDVRTRYKELLQPSQTILFLAGNIDADQAKAQLERALGSWKDNAMAGIPPTIEDAPRKKMRVFIVDRPHAVQTVVRFVMPGPAYANPERETYNALNTLLGGSFTSRLNANIREKHGYAYGAGSGFVMWPTTGIVVAVASVQAKHTGDSIREFLHEFERLRGGDVTPAEAEKARATNRQSLVASLEGLSGCIDTAIRLERNGLGFDALGKELAKIEHLDASKMNAIAHDALPIENAMLLLVGDKRLILEQIAGLKLPKPTELDVHGRPVSRN